MAHMHEIETAIGKYDTFSLSTRRLEKWDELIPGHDFHRHSCIIPTVCSDGKRL